MPRKISLRDLALRLGLSQTTVSEALRGVSRVNPATRAQVEQAALELGYRRNRLVGELMSELRRARVDSFKGTLAVLDLDGPHRRSPGGNRYHAEVLKGATARATELDFRTDSIVAEAEEFSLERVRQILRTRGIRGILVLPLSSRPELADFDWTGFSALYADYLIDRPGLHAICPDHYRAMMMVLEKLGELGYRKPGLVLQDVHDARVLYRWESAYNAHQTHQREMEYVPPFIMKTVANAKSFKAWFLESKCDVVIAHQERLKEWMEETGARVPETHGFCSLNTINCEYPCSGLDLRPRLLGERGVELLIGQMLRNECGVPARPLTSTMPSDWVDGPTLRAVGEK